MTKILCTFAVIFIQPQQSVLTLADGWMWLSNLININTPKPMTVSTQTTSATITTTASSFKPSFYVATSFEVILRISSLHLYHTYGKSFMSLLLIIRDQILPLFSIDTPRRDGLEEFLNRFINSNGQDFMSFFTKKN
jgi:hypothetical protein